jgi:crotonobetainyl-CoA:carnitine CoA-transferase CaiB-like acyl-CoA transferase
MQVNPLLSGVRVLDLTRLLPGPFCTLYLAQMGAEVIKVEDPAGGDYCRALSPELFALANRGKKSVTLDLKDPSQVAMFHELVKTADIVFESFRPGVMDKLGCGYTVLRQINPRIVYAALTGYGQTGPYRNRPGHDINYRSYAGEIEHLAESGTSIEMDGFPASDLAGGALTCAVGMLAALFGARTSGQGTFVDAAMLDGSLALQIQKVATLRAALSSNPEGALRGNQPNYGMYRCSDGKYVALGAVEGKFFREFLHLTGRTDLLGLSTAQGEAGRPLKEALSALFLTKTRDDWDQLLAGRDTCVSAVLSPKEAIRSPQNLERRTLEIFNGSPVVNLPVKFTDARVHVVGDSPELGADNTAILGALGRALADTLPTNAVSESSGV